MSAQTVQSYVNVKVDGWIIDGHVMTLSFHSGGEELWIDCPGPSIEALCWPHIYSGPEGELEPDPSPEGILCALQDSYLHEGLEHWVGGVLDRSGAILIAYRFDVEDQLEMRAATPQERDAYKIALVGDGR